MRASIQLGEMRATIDGWNWTGNDKQFVAVLNSMLNPDGPSGGDPAPNYHEAQRVAKLLGAEVIDFELPPYQEGTVY